MLAEAQADNGIAHACPARPCDPALLLQEGCEFLIAETADGKLDLQDSFVTTDVSSSSGHEEDEEWPAPSYRRPEGLAEVASGQQEYQAVPWYSQYQGDIIRDKPVKQWVRIRAVHAVLCSTCSARNNAACARARAACFAAFAHAAPAAAPLGRGLRQLRLPAWPAHQPRHPACLCLPLPTCRCGGTTWCLSPPGSLS
jgi:hypothetical protein